MILDFKDGIATYREPTAEEAEMFAEQPQSEQQAQTSGDDRVAALEAALAALISGEVD